MPINLRYTGKGFVRYNDMDVPQIWGSKDTVNWSIQEEEDENEDADGYMDMSNSA